MNSLRSSACEFRAFGHRNPHSPFRISHSSARRGITLVEILVALAVFAVAFVGIARVLAGLVDAAKRVEEARYIRGQMESRLAQVRKGFLQPMKEEQQPDERGVVYLIEVKPETVKSDKGQTLAGLWQVRVEARWKSSLGGGTSDELSVRVYQP